MKNSKRRKMKQMCMTAAGIFCVAALFLLALVFPKYYYRRYDENILNVVTYTDMHVDTYEVSYDSFVEKLHVITRVYHDKGTIQAVRLSELGTGMNKASLTKIANQELKKLRKQNVLVGEEPPLKLKKKQMVLCERYVFYGSVNCWKLVYDNNTWKVTLYLDEEYHKIYYVAKSNINLPTHSLADGSPYDENYVDEAGSSAAKKYGLSNWWEGLLRYYNFSYQYDNIALSKVEYEMQGYIIFENKYELLLYDELMADLYGNFIWQIGIPIEKMLQF